jgi:DNA primase
VIVLLAAFTSLRLASYRPLPGGTAIDLVMTTQGVRFPEAIELLARRAGVAAVDRPPPALRTARIQRPEPAEPAQPGPEVERFVAAAEGYLWWEEGRPMQQWLVERGPGEEVLPANRVGADSGPSPHRLELRSSSLQRR